MTLKELFEFMNLNREDVDLRVDKVDVMTIWPPIKLTDEGLKKFGSVLNMEVKNNTVLGNEKDYRDLKAYMDDESGKERGGRLILVWDLLMNLAGYGSERNYEKWFKTE